MRKRTMMMVLHNLTRMLPGLHQTTHRLAQIILSFRFQVFSQKEEGSRLKISIEAIENKVGQSQRVKLFSTIIRNEAPYRRDHYYLANKQIDRTRASKACDELGVATYSMSMKIVAYHYQRGECVHRKMTPFIKCEVAFSYQDAG
ncbi:10689_t:CDS:2 [Acaulospora morrowiae]|uniref:10689_t:CDS:1 n=1 Tax=Acaulospora morrowiae TaxID=94023 RepID=A0A9N8WP91_9GLOM|nr:10689_t:CDS:2 [Acaulospora morrowiae]